MQKVSVELKNVSVVRLIKELKRQTGLDFLYNVDEVTRNGNISVSAVNEAVEDVLALVRETPARQVVLIPLMLVAGDHATNDMAGPEGGDDADQGRGEG